MTVHSRWNISAPQQGVATRRRKEIRNINSHPCSEQKALNNFNLGQPVAKRKRNVITNNMESEEAITVILAGRRQKHQVQKW